MNFSHAADFAVPGLNEVFLVYSASVEKAARLQQQGEQELKHASKERDFYRAGEARKEGEWKLSESKRILKEADKNLSIAQSSFAESTTWQSFVAGLSGEDIEDMRLENCGIDVFALNEVLRRVKDLPIKNLNLAGNDISDLGAFLLADNTPDRLESLDVRNCGLTTDGCVRLLQALVGGDNKTLKRLDIAHNQLADKKALQQAVEAITSISHRELEINYY